MPNGNVSASSFYRRDGERVTFSFIAHFLREESFKKKNVATTVSQAKYYINAVLYPLLRSDNLKANKATFCTM